MARVDRCGVVADRERVGADTLDKVFSLAVLLQHFVGVYRWLQLLQFFKEPKILIPDLLVLLKHLLLVERLAIDDEVFTDLTPIVASFEDILACKFQIDQLFVIRPGTRQAVFSGCGRG